MEDVDNKDKPKIRKINEIFTQYFTLILNLSNISIFKIIQQYYC